MYVIMINVIIIIAIVMIYQPQKRQAKSFGFCFWVKNLTFCFRDENGYYQITGRMDDVINVTGHRLGTAEVEDVMVKNLVSLLFFALVITKLHEIIKIKRAQF